jgi:hypothetical protein
MTTKEKLTERMHDDGYAGEILGVLPDPYVDNVYLALIHPSGIQEEDHSRDYALLFLADGEIEECEAEDFHHSARGGCL